MPVSLSALALLAAATASDGPILLAQVIIEQRATVRVKGVTPSQMPAPVQRVRWEEKKGPKCIQMNMLAGTVVSSPNSIDLLLRGGSRMRIKLAKSCPSIDFYSGFYVRTPKDGRICEDRDQIHARTGGECEIENFKLLVPAK